MLTTRQKIETVSNTLAHYVEQMIGEPDDNETIVIDFLADLHHYCRRQHIDIDKAFRMAKMHYEYER